jgi:hypothetical protein
MTDTMPSKNIDISSWDILYNGSQEKCEDYYELSSTNLEVRLMLWYERN